MFNEALAEIALYVTIVAQLSLIALLVNAKHHATVRWVMIVLAATCAIWPAGLLLFITQTDNLTLATVIAKVYYVDGVLIGILLLLLAHMMPYRHKVAMWLKLMLVVMVVTIVAIVSLPGAMIEAVHLSPDHNSVDLNTPLYFIYVLFFGLVAIAAMTRFVAGYQKAIRSKQHQIAAQTRTMIAGIAVALGFGLWFNILLPFWGDYSYIWAGPPFTLLFVVAMFYAIIGQGLFDLRAALARSTAYLLLLVTIVAGYAIIVFTITNFVFGGSQRGQLITYVVVALFFTLTYPPVKRFFDQLTYRLFYREDYDLGESLDDIREVTSEEIKLERLVRHSLNILSNRLAPNYISAYIVDDEGKVKHYTTGPHPPSLHQRRLQIDVVGTMLDRLPRVLDAHDTQILDETGMTHMVSRTNTAMVLRFIVQREHIGALFLGDKQNGSGYNDKDLHLLATAADELALAIQNAQRFEEIEHFNDTLQSRIDSATRRLRRSNAELKKLDKAKDEFVSLASHQLRTPLTSIKGYLSMVLEGDVGKITPQQRTVLEQAFASSERMVRLIADFLSVSRLQTDKFTINLEPTDLNRLIEQIVASMHPIASEHKQKLSYDGVPNKRLIMIDAPKMQQVVMNFIDNAIYYSSHGGKVHVTLEYQGKDVVLKVTDTGIGVPKKEQVGLFSKFYRSTTARQMRPDGTGVGLYLVKRIITDHNGSVIFESKEGKGSTFGFRIPLIDAELKDDTQQTK